MISPKFILFCASVFILVIAIVILASVMTMQKNSAGAGASRCARSEDSLSLAKPIEEPQQTRPTEKPGQDEDPTEVSVIPDPAAYPESAAFDVEPADAAKPAQFGFTYEIRKNNRDDSYTSNPNENAFSFGRGSDYTQVKGVTTFAGNNYRSGFAYGTARVTMQTLDHRDPQAVRALHQEDPLHQARRKHQC